MKIQCSLIVVFVLLMSEVVFGQNARFSQIGSAPLMLNPSLSGRFDGKLRVGSLLSWQQTTYSTTYREATMAHQNFFVDFKFGKYRNIGDEEKYDSTRKIKVKAGKKPKEEAKDETVRSKRYLGYWSAGFNFYHYGTDIFGIYDKQGPIKASFYSLTLARHFYLRNNRYIGVAGQATYADGKVDGTGGKNSYFDQEISGNGFKFDSSTNMFRANSVASGHYWDFNIGTYFGIVTDQLALELGISMAHLFYPQTNIITNDHDLNQRHRITLHSVVRFKLASQWAIVQKNIFWQEGLYYRSKNYNDQLQFRELYVGVELYKTFINSEFNLNFGGYTRSFRTLMPYINLGLGKCVNLRFSYEFPINSKKYSAYTANRTELGLFYSFRKRTPTGIRMYDKLNYW